MQVGKCVSSMSMHSGMRSQWVVRWPWPFCLILASDCIEWKKQNGPHGNAPSVSNGSSKMALWYCTIIYFLYRIGVAKWLHGNVPSVLNSLDWQNGPLVKYLQCIEREWQHGLVVMYSILLYRNRVAKWPLGSAPSVLQMRVAKWPCGTFNAW